MAVDHALLHAAEDGATAPVLRFYSWARPTLSIGRLQKGDGVDLDYLASEGIPMVRRPTGGRALLHDHELTYSVTLPAGARLYGSLDEVYTRINIALVRALASHGIRPDRHDDSDGRGYSISDACFATRLGHEISVDGRKVAAGAQRRLKRSAMQHGSILLTADVERSMRCLIWPDPRQRHRAGNAMAGLCDLTGHHIGADQVSNSVIGAFAELYQIEYETTSLSLEEEEAARMIITRRDESTRYAGAF